LAGCPYEDSPACLVKLCQNGRRRLQVAYIAAHPALGNEPEGEYLAVLKWKTGAGEGIRTLDPNLGKVVLYP
jgi:hypothetical protein